MTAFAQHLPIDGRLLWWGIEVSFDDFDTIAYRWATKSGDVEGQFFEQRIKTPGTISRALGSNHLPVASACTVLIDNTDFAMDWLLNRTTVASQVFRARFRIKCGLADPSDPTVVTQKVGTFVCMDFPRRKNAVIQLSLADDSMGQLADSLVPPTPKDWFESAPGTTDSVFPSNIGNCEPLVDWEIPTPLQFGRPYYTGKGLCTFPIDRTPADFDTAGGFEPGHRKYIYPILVLATRDTVGITANDVTALRGVFRADVQNDTYGFAQKGPLNIPPTFNNYNIWKAYKTDTITKDGYDWKLLWVAFDCYNYTRYLFTQRTQQVATNGNLVQNILGIPCSPEYPPANNLAPPSSSAPTGLLPPFIPYRTYFAAFDFFEIAGGPGSGITGKSDLSNVCDPINIMQDFVEHYTALGSSAVDTARFARAQLVTKILATGSISFGDGVQRSSGDVQLNDRRSPYGIGTMRKAIGELAASADLDVFMTMEGQVGLVVQGADFATATDTPAELDEERIADVEDFIPSAGERWSPYNRVFLQAQGGQAGPYDDPGGSILSWGRVLPRILGTKWWWNFNTPMPVNSAVENVWNTRNLEAKVRPLISFKTDITALAIELGDYFTMSWTRGGENAAYTSTLWRLESVKIDCEKGSVDVVAVWMDDLVTDNAWLLDSEALHTRVAASGGRTATVTDGSDTVIFSTPDLVADGVMPGDILRLRDSSESLTGFTRNRDLLIDFVDDAQTLILAPGGDFDFGTAGAHAVAEWSIVAGATSFPTAVSDPANYPSGGNMYGKVTDGAGEFSDATEGNKLLDG